jgi:3-deoxy-manno-octulosonate cytidylyltransferase (CMP-KDO synthetase)
MINQKNTAIIIPVRLASTRLPNKPLLLINNKPMVLHVWERAVESSLGRVIVATDSNEIGDIILKNGGEYCMTSESHQSGSDRIYEALNKSKNSSDIEFIINLQGDLPNIQINNLSLVLNLLEDPEADIGTLVANIDTEDEYQNYNVVKALCNFNPNENSTFANDFIRSPLNKFRNNLYHHIGIYSYKRKSLEKFVNLEQSLKEKEFKLEQLRAMDNEMKIKAALIDFLPIGVDTLEDLAQIKKIMEIK